MQMGKFPTEDGQLVFIGQSSIEHMAAHPIAEELLLEAIWNAKLSKNRPVTKVDMGRIVGRDGKIVTHPIRTDQPALFARRHNRTRPSRCVVELGEETQFITMVTRKGDDYDSYFFISAWPGTPAHMEPRGRNDWAALDFWGNHALSWDPELFIEEPFESTWDAVLSRKWPKQRAT
jgi:hypothetical protein